IAYGGGIYNYNFRTLSLTNSTVSGNSATGVNFGVGGGIFDSSLVTLTLTNSTVSGNSATGAGAYGGGIFVGGYLIVKNTIVAMSGGGNCFNAAAIISDGHN